MARTSRIYPLFMTMLHVLPHKLQVVAILGVGDHYVRLVVL